MFFHSAFAVLLMEEIECLDERAFALSAEEVHSNTVGVAVTAPYDAEGLKQIAVDVARGRQRFSQLGYGRSGDICDARGEALQPRVSQNLSHLEGL